MIFEKHGLGLPQSISATYFYDSCIVPFMIILGAAGLLLMTYNGYDKQDKIVCTIAGLFALMICLFPCSATEEQYIGTFGFATNVSG